MTTFDYTLIDPTEQQQVVDVLSHYRSSAVLYTVLDTVYVDLVCTHYPIADTLVWLIETPPPADTQSQITDYVPGRILRMVFWRSIYEQGVFAPVAHRWPDGEQYPHDLLLEHLVQRLTRYPFVTAVNTWFGICTAWLSVCNVDQVYQDLHKSGKVQQREEITPQLLAGMMEYFYF